jgi:NitT/TauT family transport system substrate-binding protein
MHATNPTLIKILFFSLVLSSGPAFPVDTLRIGVLALGTLEWEVEIIHSRKLDEKHGFLLQQRPLANAQAGKIALHSDAVDIIVSDWVWVSRQRNEGAKYTFSPYSTTSGALIVRADADINSVEDLAGKRIGIAGGELDKNWLLLIALAKKSNNIDLAGAVEKVYGAPPLLNEQLLQRKLDAVLTYWNHAARLEAKGSREILNGQSILSGLGIDLPLPMLGYVFRDGWAHEHQELIRNFLAASLEAKALLCESDLAWAAISDFMKADEPKTQNLFRMKYCEGRVKQWSDRQIADAATVFGLLYKIAGPRLTGPSPQLADGTFWNE